MAKTVVGLFPNDKQVLTKVLDDLARKTIPAENVSSVRTQPSSALEGAGRGAVVGGFGGLAIGASTLMSPGIGWVALAGPIATMLAGAAAGTAAGGLMGALTSKGVAEEHAHFFAEGLRRGGTLIIVNAQNHEQAQDAEEVMMQNGAVDIQERRGEWMRQGWQGRFDADEAEAPLTPDEEQESDIPLAAVCVYDVVIELPAQQYGGPERRQATRPYSGMDRRAA
jgi:hypothetical protein